MSFKRSSTLSLIMVLSQIMSFRFNSASALTNVTCPDSGPYSPDGSGVQQMIIPWDWSQQEWMTNVGSIFNTLSLFCPDTGEGFPVCEGVVALWDIGSAIWGDSQSKSRSSNTVHKLMTMFYSLVEQKIEATTQGNINSVFDDVNDKILDYQAQTNPSCDNLESALNFCETGFNYMKDYEVTDPSRIFLHDLLTIATLHLGTYREMYYNATKQKCSQQQSYYLNESIEWYNTYNETFYNWLPNWHSWRLDQISHHSEKYKDGGEFYVKDLVTGMDCKLKTPSEGEAENYSRGTFEAMKREVVALMLSSLDGFSTLHRLIPGQENSPARYPPESAAAPLSMYRMGIWVGPYRPYQAANGGNPVSWLTGFDNGKNDIVMDNLGIPVQVSGSAGQDVNWMQFTYNYGKGHSIGKNPGKNMFNWEVPLNGSWIEWLALRGFTNANIFSMMQAGFNNSKGDYSVTAWEGGDKCQQHGICEPWLNMTLGSGYALVGIGQQFHNEGGANGGGSALGTIMSAWMPASLLSELGTEATLYFEGKSREPKGLLRGSQS